MTLVAPGCMFPMHQNRRSATELNLNVKLHPVWPFLNTHKTQIFVDCFALFQSVFQMLYSPQPSKSCTSPSPSRAPWPGLWFSACGLNPTFAGQGRLGIVRTVWISKGLQLGFGELRLWGSRAVPEGVAGCEPRYVLQTPRSLPERSKLNPN